MKFTGTYKYLALAASVAPFMMIGAAEAQSLNLTSTVTVQNTITAAKAQDLNFGTLVAIADTSNAAKVATIDLGTDGTLGAPATTGAPALFAVVDSTAAKAGLINFTQAADNAAINITITTTTAPTNTGHAFTINKYITKWNGGGDADQTSGTKFTQTYLKAFGGGTNTLAIGMSISTDNNTYSDNAYTGAFKVDYSY